MTTTCLSSRVAQAACDSDTSGSDHAVDDEDGSDSEVPMRCEFVDSMAAESRSVQLDEGATSADSARSGQVRFITRPKSRTMRATRQLMLPPSTVS